MCELLETERHLGMALIGVGEKYLILASHLKDLSKEAGDGSSTKGCYIL